MNAADRPWEELSDFELAIEAQNTRREREKDVRTQREEEFRARHDAQVRKVEEETEQAREARRVQSRTGSTQLALPRVTSTRSAPFNVPNPGNQDDE